MNLSLSLCLWFAFTAVIAAQRGLSPFGGKRLAGTGRGQLESLSRKQPSVQRNSIASSPNDYLFEVPGNFKSVLEEPTLTDSQISRLTAVEPAPDFDDRSVDLNEISTFEWIARNKDQREPGKAGSEVFSPRQRPLRLVVPEDPISAGVAPKRIFHHNSASASNDADLSNNYIIRLKKKESSSSNHPKALLHKKRATEQRARDVHRKAEKLGRENVSHKVHSLKDTGMIVLEGVMNQNAINDIIASDDVAFIERDVPIVLAGEECEQTCKSDCKKKCNCMDTLHQGPKKFYAWGLDRLDNFHSIMHTLQNYQNTTDTIDSFETEEYENADDHVAVYIIDTGIYVEHPDFQGRAKNIWSKWPNKFTDGRGHGTHVASVIGGAWSGVAKKAFLYGLKAMPDNSTGRVSDVIEAIDFAVRDHKARESKDGYAKSIINLSLITSTLDPISFAVEEAVREATEAGIIVVCAAGNFRQDVGKFSPARMAQTITVGATDYADKMTSFSNFGSAVDILAPGHNIPAATIPSDRMKRAPPPKEVTKNMPDQNGEFFDFSYNSGTSQAAPHVSGVVATLLQMFRGAAPSPQIIQRYLKYYSWMNAELNEQQKLAKTTNGISATRFCV